MSVMRNPELKQGMAKMAAFHILFVLLVLLLINSEMVKLNHQITDQNIALLGRMLSVNTDLESQLVPLVTRQATAAEVENARRVLAQYGYQDTMPAASQPVLKDFYRSFELHTGLALTFYLLPLLLLLFREYHTVYQKTARISHAAEKVVEGNFTIRLPEAREGEFAILGHSFNLMAERLHLSLNKLQEDKDFLKNIISDISHQLKTPLSSLITMNELLLQGKVSPEHTREFLDKSRSQLNRMEWLIISMLKMARLEAGAIQFRSVPTLLNNPVEAAVNSLHLKIEEKQQTVAITGMPDTAMFTGDEEWTSEALTNIIKNCVEHTPRNGTIRLHLEETPLFSRLTIQDDGEGIAPRDLPHIFERFYKGANSIKAESVGIGLALARVIVEGQGGTLTACSKKGEGAQFIMTFLKGVI